MRTVTANRPAVPVKRLLRTPSPHSDESLMGYLLRLAAANHYESAEWILDLAGLKLRSLDEGWGRLCDDHVDFTRLGYLTGLTLEEVENLTYRISSRAESGWEKSITGWNVPASAIRFSRPKVCPECLRESSHSRRLWELLPMTACLLHQALLMDRCPACRQPISWNRRAVSVCRCGSDWREVKTVRLEERHLTATKWLMRARNCAGPDPISSGERSALLEQLSFGDLCCVLLGLAQFFPVGEKGVCLHMTMENKLCHEAMEQAAAVLTDWPAWSPSGLSPHERPGSGWE